MSYWQVDEGKKIGPILAGMMVVVSSAVLAMMLFVMFYSEITTLNSTSSILINAMFVPAMAIGFLYGVRVTEKAVKPSVTRSPVRRAIVKTFLFLFVVGGMFSTANFAINEGTIIPDLAVLESDEPLDWLHLFVVENGGAAFLIVTSITLMASATKRMVGMNRGVLHHAVTFVGTFIFFSMLGMSFSDADPTSSGIFLYTFYQAGVVGGAFYMMNRLTKNQNMLEDFSNGY